MGDSTLFFVLLTLFCIVFQGFFAMMEMACVSFDKIRLQYNVKNGDKRSILLNKLLENPTYLFGVTLFGVNTFLQLGSEASRRFYLSVGLSPDIAPVTQVVLVLLFAEIVPMFAGRRYAQNIALLGVPILYFLSVIFRPIIILFDLLTTFCTRLFSAEERSPLSITLGEFQQVLQDREEGERAPKHDESDEDFRTNISSIFSLKEKQVRQLMQPLSSAQIVSSSSKVGKVKRLLAKRYASFIPIYHEHLHDIVAILYPRDLLRLEDAALVQPHWKTPWFITEASSIFDILTQFRSNNQSVAVVLNSDGHAVGFLTLDRIVDEILGVSDNWDSLEDTAPHIHDVMINRSFSGDMKVAIFNELNDVFLDFEEEETLEERFERELGQVPSKGSSVRIGRFELTLLSDALIGERKLHVKTLH